MKKTVVSLVLLFVMVFSHIGFTQDDDLSDNNVKFGMGVELTTSINALFSDNLGTAHSIYLPILINNQFKLEPFIGFWRNNYENGDYESSNTYMSLGGGAFFTMPHNQYNAYIGGRAALTFNNETEKDYPYTDTDKRNRKFFEIGPAVGGEYFLGEHFSLGGEVWVKFTM